VRKGIYSLRPDLTIAVRMDETNENVLDYYLLPSIDMSESKIRLAEENGVYLDAYRFDTLDIIPRQKHRSPNADSLLMTQTRFPQEQFQMG
jgi:hypothetical protein